MPSFTPATPALDPLLSPLAALIDRLITDKPAADAAKLALLALDEADGLALLQPRVAGIIAEANDADPWVSRARPSFLYVMYLIILWALPMGLIAAFRPDVAGSIAHGMNGYLAGIPEPLYGLFGTCYLGYTAARQWGKIAGSDK